MIQRQLAAYLRGHGASTVSNGPPSFSVAHRGLHLMIEGSRPEVFAAWLADVLNLRGMHGERLVDALGGPFGRYPAGDPDNGVTADRWLEEAGAAGWIGVGGPSRPTLSQRAFHGLGYGPQGPPPRPSYFFWEPGPAREEARRFVRAMGAESGLPPPPKRRPPRRFGFPYDPAPLLDAPFRFGVIDRRTGAFLPGSYEFEEALQVATRLDEEAARAGVAEAEVPGGD